MSKPTRWVCHKIEEGHDDHQILTEKEATADALREAGWSVTPLHEHPPSHVWTLEWSGYIQTMPSTSVEVYATEDAAWAEVKKVAEKELGMSFEAWVEQNKNMTGWGIPELVQELEQENLFPYEFEIERKKVRP